jgi:hypothetical protein
VNGQVYPGDVDRVRFRAQQGQALVIQAHARRLVPFLADAVPGWFQATLAVYSPEGKELAFADDYRFDPDPVLLFRVPETGLYELEVRDSIYRGREDFIYRLSVGEQPFITSVFPLGGRAGVNTIASVDGWNLPTKRLTLGTEPGSSRIRQASFNEKGRTSNRVVYAVDALPECMETEPNDAAENAQQVGLPTIINGRIARPGDVDVFRFNGRAGDEVVAEVDGRRLRSPLDSLLRLTDAAGRVLEWNDDHTDKDGHLHRGMGCLTHHADSYLRVRLPRDGIYHAHLADAQRHGGESYAYRLRLTPPRPDFGLLVVPSSINVRAGHEAPVTVHALRKDGFGGEISVGLRDAPEGLFLVGGRIPAGHSNAQMALRALRNAPREPIALRLEGRALVGGQVLARPGVPCEDAMQAFLWRHLAPSQGLMVAVIG